MKDQLINILLTALVIVVIPAAFEFIKYVIRKGQEHTAQINNKIAQIAVNKFLGVLFTCVEAIEVTVKKDINTKMADGKYTLEEAKQAKAELLPQVIEQAKAIAGEKIVNEVQKEVGNVTDFAKVNAETYLESLKKRLGNTSNANTSSPLPASN